MISDAVAACASVLIGILPCCKANIFAVALLPGPRADGASQHAAFFYRLSVLRQRQPAGAEFRSKLLFEAVEAGLARRFGAHDDHRLGVGGAQQPPAIRIAHPDPVDVDDIGATLPQAV